MSSFEPQRFNFLGADRILKGTDWIRDYQFVDSAGLPIDMSQYDNTLGAVMRAAIKSADLATTYFSSALGSIVLSWIDVYTLRIKVPAASSAALAGVIPNSAIYQIEGVSLSSSLTDRLLEGRVQMDFEVVTAST